MRNPTLISSLQRAALLLAVGLLMSAWLAPHLFAQGRMGSPEEMQARMAARTDTLVKQLDLQGEQEAAFRAIMGEQNTKRLELRTEARESGSFTGMRDKMATLAEETDTKLAAVLTEAQMATYKKIQEEQRGRRGGRRGGQ